MLDTYDDYNPNNPINQDETEKEIIIIPETLFDSVNECNDVFIDLYFERINEDLINLITYAECSEHAWLANKLNSIKNLLK